MSKPISTRINPVKDRYWTGLLTGVFIGCFFIAAILTYLFQIQGITVCINPQELAQMAQNKVQAAAAQDLPILLEEIKSDLPRQINKRLDGLTNLTIEIDDNRIPVSTPIIKYLRKELESILAVAIHNTLNEYQTAKYEKQLARHTYELVHNMLEQEIIGKTYLLKTNHWFQVPVKIVGSSHAPGLQWGI